MKLVLILFILTFLSLPAVVNAVDSTTVGTPTVVGLTRLITIQAPYTGDDNANNFATFQYKKAGENDWLNTFPMYVDRTNRIWHGVSYGLETDTNYDIRVVFTDADGVTGSPWTGTKQTKKDGTRPLGTGPVYWVDGTNGNDANPGTQAQPWRTISRSVSSLAAGVTVRIKAGTYKEQVTIAPASSLGSVGNPITFESAPGETVIIDGEFTRNYGFNIGAYGRTIYDLVFRGLTVRNTLSSNIRIDYTNYVTVEDCVLEEARFLSGLAGALEMRGRYLTFRRNTVTNTGAYRPDPPYKTDVDAVFLWGSTGGEHSVYDNLFQGGRYDDAVATGPEGSATSGWVRDSEFYNNTINEPNDDGWQFEGGVARSVAWDNVVTNPRASGFGIAPVVGGPAWIVRNLVIVTNPSTVAAGIKTGDQTTGKVYVIHNTFIRPDVGIANYGGGGGWTNQEFYNNIVWARGYAYWGIESATGNTFNYNLLYTEGAYSGYLVDSDSSFLGGAKFTTLAQWQAATGQDLNSIQANPLLDSNYRPLSNSPAIDAAYYFPQVGDPFTSLAPDMGAFEYDSGAPPTFGFTLSTSPTSGSVIQGGSISTTITATLASGSTQSVSFTASGLPSGASPSFSLNSCNPTCSSTLTIFTISTTPSGTYPITITGAGGGLTRTTSYSLTVSSTDTTKPSWSNNQTNSTLAGVFVNHSVVLTDETALDYYIFEFDNGTGVRNNISTVDISGTQVTANRVVLINSTVGSTIRWRYYFNDTSNNWNSSDLFSYRTASVADITPPVRRNGQPNGTLAAGTNQTSINLTTNEAATCRYSNTSGISYNSMNNSFNITGSTIHSRLITGLTNGNSYSYYVRCNDTAGNVNTDDFNISFSVGLTGENCVDNDADSYYSTVNCTAGNDCNDNNNATNPSAAEICGNGIDENCDNTDASCTACSDGSIPSTGCTCGVSNYYSGYCCSNAYQTSACQPVQPPSPPPSGGGGVVITSPAVETNITKEPEVKEAVIVEENIGAISLELITPDNVESGEMFNATIWLLSPVTSAYSLTVDDMQQEISLEAGKERLVTIPVRAPEARGVFTLTAAIDGTSRAKNITLDYLPLFLYVNETRVGNETLINVTVKNYESMSTELRVIKDGRSDAFFELIEGKKEYNRQLKLTQAGEYKIIASASSQGKIIDTDEYLLTVAGEKGSDYRLILIIVFAFVVMVITLVVMIR